MGKSNLIYFTSSIGLLLNKNPSIQAISMQGEATKHENTIGITKLSTVMQAAVTGKHKVAAESKITKCITL